MKKLEKILRFFSIVVGFASAVFFVADAFIFAQLRPKLVAFETISAAEEGLMNWVGISLVLFLTFCLLSLLRITMYLKYAKKITIFSLFLIVIGVVALLFVFGDLALLSDIGKQYKHGLDQPEWLLLFPIMGFQFTTILIYTYIHFFGFSKDNQVDHVARDSNIFLIVQYVGVVCGLMGTAGSGLRYMFPMATIPAHMVATLVTLMVPYVLIVGYWSINKLQEKPRQWYDEKQMQDVGKSAFFTLVLSVIFMMVQFTANYDDLAGVIRMVWFPQTLFLILLFFSLGNLYFTARG